MTYRMEMLKDEWWVRYFVGAELLLLTFASVFAGYHGTGLVAFLLMRAGP